MSFGALDFFELLDRELAGNSLLGTPATRALDSERETGEDPLVADLADRLRARGARVWHHYDGALDMAAAPDPIALLGLQEHEVPVPVAVESDGTAKYQNMSVRERSRLRPQMLERLGWRYVPLWTIEVFTDPSSCADQIGRYLGLDSTSGDNDLSSLMGVSLDPSMTAVIDSPRSRRRSGRVTEAGADGGPAAAEAESTDTAPPVVEAADVSAEDATMSDSAVTGGTDLAGEPQRVEVIAESETAVSEQAEDKGSEEAEGQSEKTAGESPDSPVLPKEAPHDADHTWGDSASDRGHDAWLRENKPPHWG